ncbi:restriction endonuclease subunit S [Roseburia sp. AM16-25]|uniref:restriction endonuclease subunit S n=1 Tax=Roseburia sp. AM16-25 TaxID=2292065 RepID=UPI001FA9D7D3|nr:restriction endonuclease subunit S [Roseburia sp. AM16-25]
MDKMYVEDCCQILDSMRVPITASDRKEGEYPYYGANGIQDYVADYIFDDELVLLAEDGGNFGSKERPIAYRVSGKCWVNNHAHVLKPKEGLDVDYLCYSLMFYNVDGMVNGATRKKLTQAAMRKMQIPSRSMEEQKFIVDELNRIIKIKEQRQQELQLLDNLIKARFVEMFGDPFGNPKGWRRLTFKEAGERLSDGPFGSNLKSEHYTDRGIRVIRLGNIGVGRFIDDDKSYISPEHYERLKKYTCKSGEIIIGTLGEPNLRACIVPEVVGVAINKADCVHYIPKSEILNNDFVCQYINCPETLLLAKGMIHGQTRSRVSSGQIAQMPIFVPPIDLQRDFSEFMSQTDKSKVAVQKALDEAQQLFDSLMQEYFG